MTAVAAAAATRTNKMAGGKEVKNKGFVFAEDADEVAEDDDEDMSFRPRRLTSDVGSRGDTTESRGAAAAK